jgi:hypothetical protein
MHRAAIAFLGLLLFPLPSRTDSSPPPTLTPLLTTVDLNVGESQQVELTNGIKILVTLLDLKEVRDDLRHAVRRAEVRVAVAGQVVSLVAANYQLPVAVAGVHIDCAITKGYCRRHAKGVWQQKAKGDEENPWGLANDARLRLWPGGSPLMHPGTFVYPVKQRWFASATHMGNEPCHVDGGEKVGTGTIYYHYGLDIGGSEGMVEVVAATDGLVVSAGKTILPGYEDSPTQPRYDVIYLLDARGWYYRYSHLQSFHSSIRPGEKVKMGQPLGLMGKEGATCWSHLHFDICGRQPSGQWGIIDGYAFLWEAYRNEYRPDLLAVARPHHLAAVGQKVVLDGSRSWSAHDKITAYQWTFTDGTTATGPTVERAYSQEGTYSEVLKVTDGAGRVAYDFATVHVLDKERPDPLPPTIHANYAPTFAIRPGDPVTFKVRSFQVDIGNETWDFGDGSPPVKVRSDGNAKPHAPDGYAVTVHRFARPGDYIVRVEGTGRGGAKAVAHLHVRVEEKPAAPARREDPPGEAPIQP